jgi:hypothetical protein
MASPNCIQRLYTFVGIGFLPSIPSAPSDDDPANPGLLERSEVGFEPTVSGGASDGVESEGFDEEPCEVPFAGHIAMRDAALKLIRRQASGKPSPEVATFRATDPHGRTRYQTPNLARTSIFRLPTPCPQPGKRWGDLVGDACHKIPANYWKIERKLRCCLCQLPTTDQ